MLVVYDCVSYPVRLIQGVGGQYVLFLFCFCETQKAYFNYKLKDLEVISILEEKIKGKDKKYIEGVRKNFDPFLGNGNIVKVKLSEEGQKLLKSLKPSYHNLKRIK